MFGRHALNSGKPIRASEHMMLDEDIAETKGQHRVPCLIHVIRVVTRVITALSVVQVIMVIMVIVVVSYHSLELPCAAGLQSKNPSHFDIANTRRGHRQPQRIKAVLLVTLGILHQSGHPTPRRVFEQPHGNLR